MNSSKSFFFTFLGGVRFAGMDWNGMDLNFKFNFYVC